MSELRRWMEDSSPSPSPSPSPSALREQFATVDAVELARMLSMASDAELTELIVDDAVRAEALGAGFGRLGEFAIAEELHTMHGVVRFVVHHEGVAAETYDAQFADGAVAVEPAGSITPGATITLDALSFLRLLSGSANAAMLVLAGRIKVEGDELLALRMGQLFRVPGHEGVAVDPSALDAREIASVIASADDSHLRDVMGGGFRSVVLDEIFRRFPEYLDQRKAAKLQFAACFKIGGGQAEHDRYRVEIDRGECTVTAGGQGERAVTIALDGAEFLKLATGNLHPTMAVVRGKIRVTGDLASARALSSAVRIPTARN